MKLLKLVGLNTYSGPAVNREVVTFGQVVRVSDKSAEHMLAQAEISGENEQPHFTEVEGDKFDVDGYDGSDSAVEDAEGTEGAATSQRVSRAAKK